MRILLADRQSKVRYALRVLLERQPKLKVVGEVENAKDLIAKVNMTDPDVVILDWELPTISAIRFLTLMRETSPDLYIIALSGRVESKQAALTAGVDAFVNKTDPPDRLLTAIENCYPL